MDESVILEARSRKKKRMFKIYTNTHFIIIDRFSTAFAAPLKYGGAAEKHRCAEMQKVGCGCFLKRERKSTFPETR